MSAVPVEIGVESNVEDGKADTSRPSSTRSASRQADVFGGLTVGKVIGTGLGCKLHLHYDLGDAASALAASGRTAAAVADVDGQICGLLTENDVMRAYFEGALPSNRLGEWFNSGLARGADVFAQKLTVSASTPLSEVAEKMIGNVLTGDCACHHLLVQDEDGRACGVLSSLDMMHAFCQHGESDTHPAFNVAAMETLSSSEVALKMTVEEVMKARDDVFTCAPTSTMKDVLKTLLMTQQNSALIVDSRGIYGIVTPRDAVRAFAEGIPSSVSVTEWMQTWQAAAGPRLIDSSANVSEAAAMMTASNLHHLVVVSPGSAEAVGTVSSLDLALCTKARMGMVRNHQHWAGPTVGELVTQHWHLTAICHRGATLREAATALVTSGRTSTGLQLSDEAKPLRLLTENDIMRAFVYGWEPDATAEAWLTAKLIPRSNAPQHVLLPPQVRLTEAAWLMISATKPGVDACHHLVVKGVKGMEGGWLGVFSALDVARGLAGIESELEAAKTGADQTRVSAVMKRLDEVPRCEATDTLKQALSKMIAAKQNAAIVMHEEDRYTLVTPRCALLALWAGMPNDCTMEDFVASEAFLTYGVATGGPREISADLRLLDVAAVMTDRNVHHLLVQDPKTSKLSGVVSSLDLVRSVASIQGQQPCSSLGWLWSCKGPSSCVVW